MKSCYLFLPCQIGVGVLLKPKGSQVSVAGKLSLSS